MPKFNLPKRARTMALIISVAALASASLFATGPSATPEALAEKAWPVSSIAVEPSEMGPAFGAYGRFEANQRAALTSKVTAWVEAVHVREGDEVDAGELLIKLDGRDFERRVRERQAALGRARAALASATGELKLARQTAADYAAMHRAAQSKLSRHKELLEKRLISQTLFDDVASAAADESIRYMNQQRRLTDLPNEVQRARADVTAAEVALEQAQADHAATEIRAPFAGPVLQVTAAAGELSSANAVLVEMAARESFELRVEVPQTYVPRLQQYLAGGDVVSAQGDANHPLALRRLARQVRPGQSGVDAFFAPDDHSGSLPAIGQVVQVAVQLPAETNMVALPIQSIYENDRVYVIVDSRLQAVDVQRRGETGRGRDHRILVQGEALTSGSRVLATQLPQAVSGLLVDAI